jgi:hypothetical protein
MPSTARENDTWERLDDWVKQQPELGVALPRRPRTLRQHLQLVEAPDANGISNLITADVTIECQYIMPENSDSGHSTNWSESLISFQSEIKQWDIYDFATIGGVTMVLLGFIAAFIPSFYKWSVLVPVGFACMTLAIYCARHRDAETR